MENRRISSCFLIMSCHHQVILPAAGFSLCRGFDGIPVQDRKKPPARTPGAFFEGGGPLRELGFDTFPQARPAQAQQAGIGKRTPRREKARSRVVPRKLV